MSTAFFKSKEKRPRSTSNETNTSFVKNVTSRVSGLLPSTITKWFSSPSSSNANGSAPTAEAKDSSTEDEAPESPISSQPPAKRMRFNIPTKLKHFGGTDRHCPTGNIEITEIPVTPFAGMQYSTSHNSASLTPIKINDTNTNESIKDNSETETPRYGSTQHTISRIGQSVANKRKSIFEKTCNEEPEKVKKKSPSGSEKKLQFKPHLLGSPFYPGRTMYGGAASSYINRANIQQHTVALVNETKSNEDTVMSSSARRIMDLLESYSSPLMEARRIPQYIKPNICTNNSTHRVAPYANKSVSYKTQELYVPSLASIMRLKQKSRLMDATKTARQIIASHSSASNYPPVVTETSKEKSNTTTIASNTSETNLARHESDKEESTKLVTKVKTRVTRTNHGNSDITDIVTPVKLPSVTLQIDHNKLPKFTLDTPSVSKLPATSTSKAALPVLKSVESKTELPTSKPPSASNSNNFIFSNPVKVSCDSFDTDVSSPSFTFDSPERHIEYDKKSPATPVASSNKDTDPSVTKTIDWTCPDCWVKNKAEANACVCCGYKRIKSAKCTLCKLADSQAQKDKCVNCEKMLSPPSEKSSKWRCDSCWVMNDANANKCVCCGGTNLSAAEKAVKKKTSPKSNIQYPRCSGFVFGASHSEIHKEDKIPSGAPSFLNSNDGGDSTLTNIAKTQKSNKWECYSCLVMNESDRSLCVCCGTEKETKAKLPEVKFNFGMNTNNTFKFGIDPKVQEDTIAKKPEIKPILDVKKQSETNNNNLAETPTYTFTLPTKKGETQIDVLKPKSDNAVKFNFGIPKDSNVSPNKSQQCKTTDEEKDKAQATPAVIIPVTVQETTKPLGESSASPQQNNDKQKQSNITSNLPPSLEVKKDNLTVQPIPTSNEKSEPPNTFSLGSSTLKPATNLFNMPSTAGTSKDPFSSLPKTTTVTTTASSMLLMPAAHSKSETVASVTTAVTKSLIATPMFSFGENAVSNPASTSVPTLPAPVATTDKPAFQFSFGNNSIKADAAPSLLTSSDKQTVFSSPFGTSGEGLKNTSSFSFNAGSTLGTSNTLGTLGVANGHSAGNGLTAGDRANNIGGNNNIPGNTLTGNGLSTNLLTGKTLTGNTLTGNTFSTSNTMGGNNVTAPATLGGINGLPGKSLTGGNSMQHDNTLNNNALTNSTTSIFGNTVQKENMWNSNNNTPSTNLFVTNTTTNSVQKPPAFSFSTSTPFNSTSAPPNFANNTQPAQNIFGMGNQNNNQPSLFSNSLQNQSPAPMFGSPQPPSNPTPQMGLFGTPTLGSTPTFGATNSTIPSFEAPSMPSASAPAFNFGAPVQSTGVFGFGQQQAQQPQQPGVYSFGGAPAPHPVQFTMGTAPNTAGRRLRKAVRRTTPR